MFAGFLTSLGPEELLGKRESCWVNLMKFQNPEPKQAECPNAEAESPGGGRQEEWKEFPGIPGEAHGEARSLLAQEPTADPSAQLSPGPSARGDIWCLQSWVNGEEDAQLELAECSSLGPPASALQGPRVLLAASCI